MEDLNSSVADSQGLGVELDDNATGAGTDGQLGMVQEPEEEFVSNNGVPSLIEQRKVIESLIETTGEPKEGDKVYVIPKVWYESFLDPNLTESEALGPIDTRSICRDFKNFILADYGNHPYISIPEKVFNHLIEWYHLSPGSHPVITYLVFDEGSQSLITEYNRCMLRLNYLVSDDGSRRFSTYNRPIFLSITRLAKLEDVIHKLCDLFFEREHRLSEEKTKFKLWYVNDSEIYGSNDTLRSTYRLNPFHFLELPNKTHVTSELLQNTLNSLKIFAGSFIIEVKQSGQNYHWPSNYYAYNQIRPSKGITGLANLGNTCYMNSALQCLVHVPQIRDYFLYSGYEKEVNVDNPLGHKGLIARAFSQLIQNLFGNNMSDDSFSAYSPGSFKATIGHLNSMFSGYMQQDSQEFIAFLLDGIHEDLNRIKDKPYIEKPSLGSDDNVHNFDTLRKLAEETWEAHLRRNDSVITDLFVGLYESVLHCPRCDNVSVTFDPYNDLTLPLPISSVWRAIVNIFPRNSPPCSLDVQLDSTATYQDLKNYVAQHAEMEVENLYGCEIFGHQFYTNYESSDSSSQFLSLKELISENDEVIFYELHVSENDFIVPVFNTKKDRGYKSPKLFGKPFFIVLSSEELVNPGAIRLKLEKAYSNLSGGFVEFPLISLDGTESIESLPLIKKVFGDIDWEQLKDMVSLSFSVENDIDRFFSIKVLDINDHERTNLTGCTDEDNTEVSFWVPPQRFDVNRSKNLTEILNPLVNAVYDYPTFVKQFEATQNKKKKVIEGYISEDARSDSSSEGQNATVEIDKNSTSSSELEIDSAEVMEAYSTQYPILPLLNRNTIIVCEWSNYNLEDVFSDTQPINWESPGKLTNSTLAEQEQELENQEEKRITLHDCLKLFSKKEVLGLNDLWYCPNCKDHQQATKQIQLWNAPDILLIHLKRFESQRSFSDKIDDVVHFPITDLDMSEYLVNKDDSRGLIYDLIAVDNHYGGLGGGHYTAYVKNPTDEKWYYFDDSRVTEALPEDSIAGSAYLLFYKRRCEDIAFGGSRLQDIIQKSRQEFDRRLDNVRDKQQEIYTTNKTDSEDEEFISSNDHESADVDLDDGDYDENKVGVAMNSTEFSADINPNLTNLNDNMDLARSTAYSIESLEVGQANQPELYDSQESNLGRRKLRLLNKKYSDSPIGNSPVGNSPISFSSSDDTDSITMEVSEPKEEVSIPSKLP